MTINLDGHFTYKRLLKNAILPIFMMIVTSIYTIVDGIFIANFGKENEFAGINIIWPAIMMLAGVGFMFGTGGCALVGKKLGEKKNDEANQIFTFVAIMTFVFGVVLSGIFAIFTDKIVLAFGATSEMAPAATLYGRMLAISLPFFMLQNLFQNFFSVAEKPQIGLWITIVAGICNAALDAILVAGCKMGVLGAAIATNITQFIGAIIPIFYFVSKKFKGRIHLVKPIAKWRALGQSAFNGFSEFVSQISINIATICFNSQLIKYIGQDGVYAFGVILYVSAIFILVFIGFNIATAPIISYKYGEQDQEELKNLFKKCFIVTATAGVGLCILSLALSYPLTMLYVKDNPALFDLTLKANLIYSISYLALGINIYGSSFFTALNNGFVSGLISTLRTLVIQIICVFLFPLFMGADGIWWSAVICEVISLSLFVFFIYKYRKRYGYL